MFGKKKPLRFKIAYQPEGAHNVRSGIFVFIYIMLVILYICFDIVASSGNGGDGAGFLKLGVWMIISIFVAGVKGINGSGSSTTVTCYEDELVCWCGEKEWSVYLKKLDTVKCIINKKTEGDTGMHLCKLEFRYKNGREDILIDAVSERRYAAGMRAQRGVLPILEIYHWIEVLYPEKAGGYSDGTEYCD